MTSAQIGKQLFPFAEEDQLLLLSAQLERHQELLAYALRKTVPTGKKRKDFAKVFRKRYNFVNNKLYHRNKDKQVLLFTSFHEVW